MARYPLPPSFPLDTACPTCGSTARRCKRPSGHPADRWHAARVEAWHAATGAPAGAYETHTGRAVPVPCHACGDHLAADGRCYSDPCKPDDPRDTPRTNQEDQLCLAPF